MTRLLLILLALTLLMGFAVAQGGSTQRHHSVTIQGVIRAVDAANHRLALETRHGTVPVAVGDRTRIGLDGQPAMLADLQPGMRAAVTGRPDRQRRVFRARIIRARS